MDFILIRRLHEAERRNRLHSTYRVSLRYLRDNMDAFALNEVQFIKEFRLTKGLAKDLIDKLAPFVDQMIRPSDIPFHIKVLLTLNFLGHGSYQKSICSSFVTSMSQSSASRAISTVAKLMVNHLLGTFVKFPTTEDDIRLTKLNFFTKYACRGVIGAIDGTHVRIIAPPVTDIDHPSYLYINRKGVHTINVMLISDANTKILVADARYPGSVHDSAIWKVSEARNFLQFRFNHNDDGTHLIGDSGYPLEPWLFTPVLEATDNSPEARYNDNLRKSRNVIERTNGLFKARFRSMLSHRALHYHPKKAAYLIYSAVILHNMCIDNRIIFENFESSDYNDDESQLDQVNQVDVEEPSNAASRVRGRTARQNFILRNFV